MRAENKSWPRATVIGVLALGLVAAGIALFAIYQGGPQVSERARQYTASQACLLTGPKGLVDPQTATVWNGMEDASLATHAKVTYLAVNGPATASNAVPYANSLIEQHCGVILAAGAPQAGALSQIAPRTPKTRFVILGNGSSLDFSSNLQTIRRTANTRAQVAQAVEALTSG